MLATTLISAFQSGVTLWAFVDMGWQRMVANEVVGQELRRNNARACAASCPQEVHDDAYSFHAAKGYQTAGELGEEQNRRLSWHLTSWVTLGHAC